MGSQTSEKDSRKSGGELICYRREFNRRNSLP
jgi:hypothetical protein